MSIYKCTKTISGKHVLTKRNVGYRGNTVFIECYCKVCGLIDDTGEFMKELYGK